MTRIRSLNFIPGDQMRSCRVCRIKEDSEQGHLIYIEKDQKYKFICSLCFNGYIKKHPEAREINREK